MIASSLSPHAAASNANAAKSLRNLPDVNLLAPDQLNAYDVLANEYLVFTKTNIPGAEEVATSDEAQNADGAAASSDEDRSDDGAESELS